jgi:hypothetical protein
MARRRTRPSVYLVQRLAVTATRWGDQPTLYVSDGEERSAVPVRGFADETAAAAHRTELERQTRESTPVGPFLPGLVPERVAILTAAARAAGLPPPDLSGVGPEAVPDRSRAGVVTYTSNYFEYRVRVEAAVCGWWAGVAADVTPTVNAELWGALCPEHRFYEVVRIPLED